MKKAVLPEAFLHFLWQTQRFQFQELKTTAGQSIQVIHPGQLNSDAGPDFRNARIRLGETLWVGQVEIHWYSSEWFLHGHQKDPAYKNVILHVVFEDDQPVCFPNGTPIPTLTLEGRISPAMVARYKDLRAQPAWLACRHHFPMVKSIDKAQWIDRMGVERLETLTDRVEKLYQHFQGNWDQLVFVLISRSLGLRVNSSPMEDLASRIPLTLLQRYSGQRTQLESLLFGLAGMLSASFDDEYPQELKRTARYLQHKHQLHPMQGVIWKFSRMRPTNFPTLRLAQLAALFDKNRRWMADLLDCIDLNDLRSYLQFEISGYWLVHYRFDKPTAQLIPSRFGESTFNLIIINALAPIVFHYGRARGRTELCLRAQYWLEQLPPEQNAYLRQWQPFDIQATSAFHSQGLLHWRKHFCEQKRCLDCQIGRQILNRKG